MLGSPSRLATVLQHSLRPSVSPSQEPFADDPPSSRLPARCCSWRGARRRRLRRRTTPGAAGRRPRRAPTSTRCSSRRSRASRRSTPATSSLAMKIEAHGRRGRARGPGQRQPEGPVPGPGRGRAAQVQARRRLRGRRPEHHRGRHVHGREGLHLLPGHRLRRRRPDLPAVQGRLRGGAEGGRRAGGPELRLAGHGPAQVADRRQERGRGEGRRRRHDQDHRRRRRGEAARRRQQRARQGLLARAAGAAAARCPRSSPRSSASRCSTRSRTRRSRSTPARTTRSCAGSSSTSASRTPRAARAAPIGLDVSITDLNEDQDIAEPSDAKPFNELLGQLGGLGALGGAAAAAAAPPTTAARAAGARLRRGPREVLRVPHRGGQRRRQGAQVRRPPDGLNDSVVVDLPPSGRAPR